MKAQFQSPSAISRASTARALRITVVARSVGEVTTTETASSLRPAAEDREASTTPDVYKRRALSTTVEIRNLTGSPL